MIYEFCAENLKRVMAAIQQGASRIELCDNLACGGTTPSFGVLKAARHIEDTTHIPFMPMLRPRGGDFCYSDEEKQMMLDDITLFNTLGFNGLVFGALTSDKKLDIPFIKDVMAHTTAKEVTFHMAFDVLSKDDQFEAIEILSNLGITRILTHGGASDTAIMDNLAHLSDLIHHASGRLIILPGGGITTKNRDVIAQTLHVTELHGTRIVPLDE